MVVTGTNVNAECGTLFRIGTKTICGFERDDPRRSSHDSWVALRPGHDRGRVRLVGVESPLRDPRPFKFHSLRPQNKRL